MLVERIEHGIADGRTANYLRVRARAPQAEPGLDLVVRGENVAAGAGGPYLEASTVGPAAPGEGGGARRRDVA